MKAAAMEPSNCAECRHKNVCKDLTGCIEEGKDTCQECSKLDTGCRWFLSHCPDFERCNDNRNAGEAGTSNNTNVQNYGVSLGKDASSTIISDENTLRMESVSVGALKVMLESWKRDQTTSVNDCIYELEKLLPKPKIFHNVQCSAVLLSSLL